MLEFPKNLCMVEHALAEALLLSFHLLGCVRDLL